MVQWNIAVILNKFEEIRQKMIESNLRLVVGIAKKHKNMGMELGALKLEIKFCARRTLS
jgi:DNA-directed RNA polymerase sigma subunit (sigma70/sigma32)